MTEPGKILIIQSASIGDVILTTPVLEALHKEFPGAAIDFLLKKGIENLFKNHPYLHQTIVWDKEKSKYRNFLHLLGKIRKEKYDLVINIQRFLSSGILTAFSSAKYTVGFDKNPLSSFFTKKIKHHIGELEGLHETDRNLMLLKDICPVENVKVKLYPSEEDLNTVKQYKSIEYLCIAPASLWYTKQYPPEKWVEFIKSCKEKFRIYLLGSKNDHEICKRIIRDSESGGVDNLSGKLTFLETAALMKDARMNYVNDSAPQHLASAVDAPVTGIFCSTVPAFGFGPLSKDSAIVQTRLKLDCRPCGLHGFKACPEKHFKCALTIDNQELLNRI